MTLLSAGSFDPAESYGELPWKLAYRPDGEQLAVAINFRIPRAFPVFPRMVRLVDGSTYEEQAAQLGGLPEIWDELVDNEAWDLAYSGDGRFLIASVNRYVGDDFDSTVIVWDVTMPERPIQRLEPGPVGAVALSSDGSVVYLLTDEPPGVAANDVKTGRALGSLALPISSETAVDRSDGLEVSPDGDLLAVWDVNDVVLVDAVTLTERARLLGHARQLTSLEFSHGGELLASASDDGTVIVWDVADGTQRAALSSGRSVCCLAFSPDDTILYSPVDWAVVAWELRGDRSFIPRVADAARSPLWSSADRAFPAPDGKAVVYFGEPGEAMQFLDLASGELGEPIAVNDENRGRTWRPPDWEQFATIDDTGFVHVWDWRSGELAAERQLAEARYSAIAYMPDGERFVIADSDEGAMPFQVNTLFQVDADTMEPVGPPVELEAPSSNVTISGDGRLAAATDPVGLVSIVDLVDGVVLHETETGVLFSSTTISPDGERLAVGAGTGEVGLVDIESGAWLGPPVVHHLGVVLSLAFVADGSMFASSGADGRVSLWDGNTGAPLGSVLSGRPKASTAVTFLADGHTLVIADADGAVYTWDTRLEHWIDHACTVAGRNLTEAEWRGAFGDRPYRETCPDV